MTVQQIFDYARNRTNVNSTTMPNAAMFLSLNERHRQLWLPLQEAREDYGGEISTTDLVANQQEYPLPDETMKFKRAEMTYDGVNWVPVTPFDVDMNPHANDTTSVRADFSQSKPFMDVHESSLFLFPVPTANVTAGLKLWHIVRPQDITLTSASPALPKEHHIWLVDLMCIDIDVSRGRLSVPQGIEEVKSVMKQFVDLVSPRVQGERVQMRMRPKNYY